MHQRSLLPLTCIYVRLTVESHCMTISPDKARKGVIYPLQTGIYALVVISERTFTRSNF